MKIFNSSFSQILTTNFWNRCYFLHLKHQFEVDRVYLVIQRDRASELHNWCFLFEDQCSFHSIQAMSREEADS